VIHLFALLFGAGVLGLLPFVSHRRIPASYFRLASALGVAGVGVAIWLRPPAGAAAWGLWPALLLAALGAGHAGTMASGRTEVARVLAWPLLAAALLALGGEAAGADPERTWATAAAFAAGAGLLGSVVLALLLGHSYLNIPGLPISHLRRLTALLACFVAARFLLFAAAAPASRARGEAARAVSRRPWMRPPSSPPTCRSPGCAASSAS
jgi:hypothetical protein